MVLLLKSLNQDLIEDYTNPFWDIRNHWGKKYLETSYKLGFIRGYEDKSIRPDNNITLAETSQIIQRAFKFDTKYHGIYEKLKINEWYSQSMKYLFDSTVLTVNDEIYQNFNENKLLTREEAALIMSRSLSTN